MLEGWDPEILDRYLHVSPQQVQICDTYYTCYVGTGEGMYIATRDDSCKTYVLSPWVNFAAEVAVTSMQIAQSAWQVEATALLRRLRCRCENANVAVAQALIAGLVHPQTLCGQLMDLLRKRFGDPAATKLYESLGHCIDDASHSARLRQTCADAFNLLRTPRT